VKRISLFISAATVAVIGSTALWAGVASAHHPVAVGQATCMNDGTWTVTWTVGNSETTAGRVMTFDSATVSGVAISLSPSSVAPGGSATGTSTHDTATNAVTLDVTARWTYVTPNVTASATATVVKPTDCVESATTTTGAPTTTTTVAPTTTTVVDVTTTAPQVEDTAVSSGAAVGTDPATRIDTPEVAADQVAQESIAQELPATGAVSIPILVGGVSLVLVGMGVVLAARRSDASA
jgi:hypothetical protein